MRSARVTIPAAGASGRLLAGTLAAALIVGAGGQQRDPDRPSPTAHGGGVRTWLKMRIGTSEVATWLYAPAAAATASANPASADSPAAEPRADGAVTRPEPAAAPLPVLFYSGEFGWTQIHQETATRLAQQGRYVLGVDLPTYFQKDVESSVLAADFATFRATLNSKAGRPADAPLLLAGFGYGAEMIPYVLNRSGTRGVQGALLMAPDQDGAKVFRASILLKMPSPPAEVFDVGDEIRHLAPIPVVFLDGANDDRARGRAFFKQVKGPRRYVPIPGGDHQFHDARDLYFEQVINSLRWLETQTSGARPPEAPVPPQ